MGSWKLLLHSTVSSCLPEREIASSIEEVKEESCSEDERNCFSLANGRTESQFSTMPSSAAELHFFGASLQLRGVSPIVQPLIDSSKNILVYNGRFLFSSLDFLHCFFFFFFKEKFDCCWILNLDSIVMLFF